MKSKLLSPLIIASLLTTSVTYGQTAPTAPVAATTPPQQNIPLDDDQDQPPYMQDNDQPQEDETDSNSLNTQGTAPDGMEGTTDNSAEDTSQDTLQDQQPAEIKHVGKASQDGMSAAKKQQWQNIAMAAGAVIVATVALILVSNNNGKKKH